MDLKNTKGGNLHSCADPSFNMCVDVGLGISHEARQENEKRRELLGEGDRTCDIKWESQLLGGKKGIGWGQWEKMGEGRSIKQKMFEISYTI